MTTKINRIGRWQGAGLLATTLLGTGVFILPQMTIDIAGNDAMLAWLLLTVAIIPITLVFGRLAAILPHAGGPAHFVEQAYGAVAGRTIGLIFLLVVPLGVPAAILLTFQFVEPLIKLSSFAQLMAELGVLLLIFLLNYRGIQVSAKLQFILTLVIVSVVVVLFSAGSLQADDITKLSQFPLKYDLMMVAAGVAFWSFLGVEAMTHLAREFEDPKNDLLPAMLIGTVIVGLVYLACTALLLLVPSSANLSMVGVFNQLLGGYGAQVIGCLGLAGGLASVNIYTASIAKLTWSFSHDGVLPSYFSKVNRYHVPIRALSFMLIIMAIILIITYITKQNLEDIIAWCNGVFVIIYLAAMLAAIKLLDKKYLPLITISCIFCLMLAWGIGWRMVYASILLAITAPLLWWQYNHQNSKKRNNTILLTPSNL
jgi:amino acid efflux transporter